MTSVPLRPPGFTADPDSSGASPPRRGAAVRGELDVEAIRRLRELDPNGESHLLMRVFNAFETSLNRLLPQLVQARDATDAAGVRLVAHTLKSSSATVGALELSRLCADVEVQARELRLADAADGIQQMLLEAEAVREALRCLARTPDSAAGSA